MCVLDLAPKSQIFWPSRNPGALYRPEPKQRRTDSALDGLQSLGFGVFQVQWSRISFVGVSGSF